MFSQPCDILSTGGVGGGGVGYRWYQVSGGKASMVPCPL